MDDLAPFLLSSAMAIARPFVSTAYYSTTAFVCASRDLSFYLVIAGVIVTAYVAGHFGRLDCMLRVGVKACCGSCLCRTLD